MWASGILRNNLQYSPGPLLQMLAIDNILNNNNKVNHYRLSIACGLSASGLSSAKYRGISHFPIKYAKIKHYIKDTSPL